MHETCLDCHRRTKAILTISIFIYPVLDNLDINATKFNGSYSQVSPMPKNETLLKEVDIFLLAPK